jgi:chitin synthase
MQQGSGMRSNVSQTNMSMHNGQAPAMSQYGGAAGGFQPLPYMPFAGGFTHSPAGSEYGGAMAGPMPMQHTGSMYGMMPQVPHGTMMPNFNMYGGIPGSGMSATGSMGGMGMQSPFAGPAASGRPGSSFSFATNVNPFAGPSANENPTDEELVQALRNYLSTQDLMTVTKKCVLVSSRLARIFFRSDGMCSAGRRVRRSWPGSPRRTSRRARRS